MGLAKDSQYKNKFAKEKYDRIPFVVPKGQRETIQKYAKEHGYKSVNSFIEECVSDAMKANKANSQNINIGEINQTGDSNSIQF